VHAPTTHHFSVTESSTEQLWSRNIGIIERAANVKSDIFRALLLDLKNAKVTSK
jgi:hypothetical protein